MSIFRITKTPWSHLSQEQKSAIFSGKGFRVVLILQDMTSRNPFRRYSLFVGF